MDTPAIIPSPTEDKFRPRLIKLKDSGGVVFVHPCSKCGNKNAPFGTNKEPLHNKKSPNYPMCNWKNIVWECGEC